MGLGPFEFVATRLTTVHRRDRRKYHIGKDYTKENRTFCRKSDLYVQLSNTFRINPNHPTKPTHQSRSLQLVRRDYCSFDT